MLVTTDTEGGRGRRGVGQCGLYKPLVYVAYQAAREQGNKSSPVYCNLSFFTISLPAGRLAFSLPFISLSDIVDLH